MNAPASPVTVGRFTMHPNGSLTGPADYLASDWFEKCLAKIGAGQSAVFNYGSMNGEPTYRLLLVAVQTDYAAWRGAQSLRAGLRK